MNTTNNILTVNNLSKNYNTLEGETKCLKDISFDVNSGDYITILGPSGCGKSTILNIIANLDNNYKGKINYAPNCKIGYMLQEHSLFDWLTVKQNALLSLKIKKQLTKENIEYVDNLLKNIIYMNLKTLIQKTYQVE